MCSPKAGTGAGVQSQAVESALAGRAEGRSEDPAPVGAADAAADRHRRVPQVGGDGHGVAPDIGARAHVLQQLAQLRGREAMAARGLEFLILTAARSGEVLGARQSGLPEFRVADVPGFELPVEAWLERDGEPASELAETLDVFMELRDSQGEVQTAIRVAADWPIGRPFPAQALRDPSGFAGVDGAFRFDNAGVAERSLEVREVNANGTDIVSPAPRGFN